MPSLKVIAAANSSVTSNPSPSALFLGATSGIGLATLTALLKHSDSPTILLAGRRSASDFASNLADLRALNPSASITYLEAQVSSLKDVTRLCALVGKHVTKLDYLFLSSGGLARAAFPGLTPEGLNSDLAVNYYSRILTIRLLLPLLQAAPAPRVVSVFCAGYEGPLNLSDLGLLQKENWGFKSGNQSGVAMTSICMKELATQNPTVAFLHTNPGAVSSAVHDKWMKDLPEGMWSGLVKVGMSCLLPVMHMFGYTVDEAGEMGLFELRDARFAVQEGQNFFRVDDKAEVMVEGKMMQQFDREDTGRVVWEHTVGVFEAVTGGQG